MSDARTLRDGIAEDYLRNMRRIGDADISYEDCQRVAAADLELIDRAEVPERDRAEPPPAPEPALNEQLAAEGYSVARRTPVEEMSVEQMFAEMSPREKALIARMAMIAQPAIEFRRGQEHAGAHCEYPHLARKFFEAMFAFKFQRGEYLGKSPADRMRMYLRKLEDIADESRKEMGPWWVK